MHWQGLDLGIFILGTAQVGMNYGVANRIGQPTSDAVVELLNFASSGGVTTFDTAQAYGNSETVLGQALRRCQLGHQPHIITKLLPPVLSDVDSGLRAVRESCDRLQTNSLFGVLAHSFSALAPDNRTQTQSCFHALKQAGLASYTGVSVYSAQEAITALQLDEIDIIQIQLNALDRQARDEELIGEAKSRGKLLNFRSAYLQGLLTLAPDDLPPHLQFGRQIIAEWHSVCAQFELTPAAAAINIAMHLADGFPLVVGVETAEQIRKNIDMVSYPFTRAAELTEATQVIADRSPTELINPALWRPEAPSK